MNRTHFYRILILSLSLLVLLRGAASVSADSAGQVTVPLTEWNRSQEEMKSLKDQLSQKKKPDAPEAALSSIHYLARPGRGGLRIAAELTVVAFGEGKAEIALFGGPVAVVFAQLPEGTALGSTEDGSKLVVRAPGRYVVRLDAVVACEATSAEFRIPRAGANVFRMELPGATATARIEPSAGVSRTVEAGRTIVEATLPVTDELKVEWSSVGGAVQQTQGEGRVYATFHSAAVVEQSLIRGRTRFDYDVRGGAAFEFAVKFPSGVSIVEVAGEAISHWNVESGDISSLLRIHPQAPVAGTASYTITWEMPLSTVIQTAEIPRFQGVGVTREVGMVGVAGGDATEVGTAEAKGLTPLDPRSNLGALGDLADRALSYAGRFTGGEWSLSVPVKRLEAVDVVAARIEDAVGATVLLPSGRRVHRFAALVRNSTIDFLDVTLPDGAKIWGAAVAGRITRPVIGEAPSVYRLPLVRAKTTEAGGTVFGVEIVYAEDRGRPLLGGALKIAPPVLSIDADRFLWAVHLPQTYHKAFRWAGGNWESTDQNSWTEVAENLRREGIDAPGSMLGFPVEALNQPAVQYAIRSSDAGTVLKPIHVGFLTDRAGDALAALVLVFSLLMSYVPLKQLSFPRRARLAFVLLAATTLLLEYVFGGMLRRLAEGFVLGALAAFAYFLVKRPEPTTPEVTVEAPKA